MKHLDIKPGNILIVRGEEYGVRIADFGMDAEEEKEEEESSKEMDGEVYGTYEYRLSPD